MLRYALSKLPKALDPKPAWEVGGGGGDDKSKAKGPVLTQPGKWVL